MRLAITGGFGYLGSWMAELARRDGMAVTIVARRVPPYMREWSEVLDVRLADLTEQAPLEAAFRGADVVLHTAAANELVCARDETTALLVNGLGTRHVVAAAAAVGATRLFYFSTFHVYGRQATRHITEALEPHPVAAYGFTHLVGELYVRMFRETTRIDATALRISNGYGPCLRREIDRWGLVLSDFCLQAFETEAIRFKSHGWQHRDFVAIEDIWQAIGLLIRHQAPLEPAYNVGGAISKTMRDVASVVGEVYAQRYGRELTYHYPPSADGAPHEPPWEFDVSRLGALGFRPLDRMRDAASRILTLLERQPAPAASRTST